MHLLILLILSGYSNVFAFRLTADVWSFVLVHMFPGRKVFRACPYVSYDEQDTKCKSRLTSRYRIAVEKTASPDTVDLRATLAFSYTTKQPTNVQSIRQPHNDAAKRHIIQASSISFHFPFPINLLLPLSQLTRKPRKAVSVFQVCGDLVVSLLLFLDIVVDLLLRWDILSVTRRVSFCYRLVGAFPVSNGIAGAGGFLCAVHAGKTGVSARGRERLSRAIYCAFAKYAGYGVQSGGPCACLWRSEKPFDDIYVERQDGIVLRLSIDN